VQEITGFILAGGQSSRMGENKAFLMFEGKPLIDYSIASARSLCEDVFIVGPKELYGAFGRIVKDVYPDCGPLGGIHAALGRSQTELNLVLPVDMPFLPPDFLRYLAEEAERSGATVCVPKLRTGYQPLCAIYNKRFEAIAESSLKENKYKVDAAFPADSTHIVTEEMMVAAGFTPRIFENLNTPEDFARAKSERSQSNHA